MSNVIFLFGPSCSGKSTLGKALQNSLGRQWTYIDRDDLIELNICTESTADKTIEERILLIKSKIIIDTQIPWREKRIGEYYFLVLPPLKVLLERDVKRTTQLKRSETRAHYAREYVKETHDVLNGMDRNTFNYYFDSSRETIEEEVNKIKHIINYKTHPQLDYFCLALAGFTFVVVVGALMINANETFEWYK